MNGRTKIVATLGPATDRPEVLDEMIVAGVDVVRLNLSHGPVDSHIARLRAVRESATRTGSVVAVLADLPGPKVRAAPFPDGGLELRAGATVSLHPGDPIVVGDGVITLKVERISSDGALCEVRNGGRAQGRPG
ncbi:MAG TPA: pyruvate kinase, partial [Ilumatobacteraceae bacterium]|nr:pyruvate kinase [Ilumatobacteraceae bacterium]